MLYDTLICLDVHTRQLNGDLCRPVVLSNLRQNCSWLIRIHCNFEM